MNLKSDLSDMERSLVLDYLKKQGTDIYISIQENPVPVAIPADSYEIYSPGTFLFLNNSPVLESMVGRNITVSFYYNHLGLFFIAKLTKSSKGYAFLFPPKITRVQHTTAYGRNDLYAVISFSVKGKSSVEIACRKASNFDLSQKPTKQSLEPYLYSSAQKYFKKFAYDYVENQTLDMNKYSFLISVCRYLSLAKTPVDVEGRASPLDIIYVDMDKIVFGCPSMDVSPLREDITYDIKMAFGLDDTDYIKRRVDGKITVKKVFVGDDNRRCFLSSFVDIKVEDMRFLSDKFAFYK